MNIDDTRNGYALFGVCDGELGVIIHDNTEKGLTWEEGRVIANEAATKEIHWSDDRLCQWMYDFQAAGHWCAGLFPNNGLGEAWGGENPYATLHINVYE